jgi:hypothetical protein
VSLLVNTLPVNGYSLDHPRFGFACSSLADQGWPLTYLRRSGSQRVARWLSPTNCWRVFRRSQQARDASYPSRELKEMLTPLFAQYNARHATESDFSPPILPVPRSGHRGNAVYLFQHFLSKSIPTQMLMRNALIMTMALESKILAIPRLPIVIRRGSRSETQQASKMKTMASMTSMFWFIRR